MTEIEKILFPLVSVWVRHEEPGNYTHLISLPRNYSSLPNLALVLILGSGELHFVLLVVSTAGIFSSVSNQVSKHYLIMFAAHTTLSQYVIAYLNCIH